MIGLVMPLMLLTSSTLSAGGSAEPVPVTTIAGPALVFDFPA